MPVILRAYMAYNVEERFEKIKSRGGENVIVFLAGEQNILIFKN